MAITVTSLQPKNRGFSINGSTADLSGCEELVAAVAGKSIYLERVSISCASAITVTVGAGETTGAVTSPIAGPITFTASGVPFNHVYRYPIKLVAATALTADASGAGQVTILAEGYIE